MFSPLQVISSYSLLQSTLKIDEYVNRGKELGYQALALTDINVMYGVLDFYHACQKAVIKPLIGLTLQLNSKGTDPQEIILLAQNKNGYQNLMKISSAKMTVNGYEAGEGPLALDQIQAFTQDLKVIITEKSPVFAGIRNHSFEVAADFGKQLLRFWQPEDVYLSVNPQMDDDLVYGLRQLQNQTGIRLIANEPVKYLHPEEAFDLQVLNAIGTNAKLMPEQLASPIKGEDYLKSSEELHQEFTQSGLEDCWQTACDLVEQIQINLEFPPTQLPHYATPDGIDSATYLRQLCQAGLKKRLAQIPNADPQQYQQRLDHELEVIHRMGFDDYFLIVWDVTNFSHTHDILVGPGGGLHFGQR